METKRFRKGRVSVSSGLWGPRGVLVRLQNTIASQREAIVILNRTIKRLEERLEKENKPMRIRRSRLSEGEQKALMRMLRNKFTEEDWLFIADEGADLEFRNIPREFRTVAVLTLWLEWDLGRVQEIPREYWTDDLRRNAHHLLEVSIKGVDTERVMEDTTRMIEESRK